jgi:hypothetical protein
MADGGATFYIYMAFAAAGTAVTVQDQRYANKARQMQLEEELRSNELAALDEENNRLMALRLANDELLVNAGGVDAWASPSLIAARNFNFQMGMEDITNIRMNLQATRSAVSTRIGILKNNSRAVTTAGIFELAGIGASVYDAYGKLGKTALDTGVLSSDGLMMSPDPNAAKNTKLWNKPAET